MDDYRGQNIWIFGASSGIGRALALELASRGARLVVSARNGDALQAVLRDLQGEGHAALMLDIADDAAVERATDDVMTLLPRLDSVIFMAAIYEPGALRQLDAAIARQMVTVNLVGAFNVVTAVLPILRSQAPETGPGGRKRGQIALCGSVAGYRGLPNGQPYSATKAGIISLAESLRAEETELDVKVINPGFVRTPLTEKNAFDMPMMIEAAAAARIIARELRDGRFEIHFPRRFTWLVKALSALPDGLYFRMMRQRRG